MLNLPDIFPRVPMIGYMEFYYQTDSADVVFDPEFPIDPADFPRVRAKNAINHIALNLDGHGVTPTRWQSDLSRVGAAPDRSAVGRSQSGYLLARRQGPARRADHRRYDGKA